MGKRKTPYQNLPQQMIGFGAALLSLYFLFRFRTEIPIAAASIFFLLACSVDTLQARIPNLLVLGLLLTGLSYQTLQVGWTGLGNSLLGLCLGFGLLVIPYAMGGFGAGDVKALAALGALTGPGAIVQIFVYMAFYGAGMALLHWLLNRSLCSKTRTLWMSIKSSVLAKDLSHLKPEATEPMRFPYAAAIAFGYYSYLTWGEFI